MSSSVVAASLWALSKLASRFSLGLDLGLGLPALAYGKVILSFTPQRSAKARGQVKPNCSIMGPKSMHYNLRTKCCTGSTECPSAVRMATKYY
ncbi:unnamed protein product [Toxocara canis]|uniref:Secreted protein n=1 Tax=Toxocara canis TaxID=6265 RepID=A0A183TYT9_TOXCA|nr:unnamed protein product [Toxocara canis]